MLILARNWWALALRGLFALALGIAALSWPGMTLAALLILYGAYALCDGLVAVVACLPSFSGRGWEEPWWSLILEGVAGIVVGMLTLSWPAITALALVYLLAAWSVSTGVLEIMAAARLRAEVPGEWALGLSGALSVLFGVILAMSPEACALALVYLLGAYATIVGLLMLTLAVRLRGRPREIQVAVG
jgi:uncharacterized membrane protein HdeD (DUF308 family)